jgi:alkylhydroperoxidase family enzyme
MPAFGTTLVKWAASAMNDRYAEFRNATASALLRGAGATPAELREAIAAGRAPTALVTLVEKVRSRAWSVTDQDVDALRDQYTEEQLFEIIVAAAFGAADERLQAALRALEVA